ncbi:uncharacterized protein LOC110058513 isoform X2 [Orbicella faveolata]|uniref:uncharacterized protein LOC110058513 isoform X2 n=1 Tax=Orbicella faveolata TaxID=48498 RepID=UPI0009E44CE3|nr:uncharacterized protein LOC110058513 isoform X2 [Orbicella faveolata]
MAYHEFLLVFTLMGMHSVCLLVAIDSSPSVLSCKKCPPGFSSACKQNETSLCVRCEKGTYSENPSRRPACKPCSSCRGNEFESQPCTSTSNVVCKECSKCAPGFWEVKPCGRTRDTVCEECPQNGQGIMSYVSVPCNEVGIEDHLILKKSKESDKAKSSLTIIEKEIPWSDDKRHDEKFTIEKQHVNVTASSLGFPSRDQAPSSSFSTKANGASTQMTSSSHSMVLVSPSVEASSISITGLPKSISPSLAPTMPAKRRSPPPPPKVPRTKATFPTVTKEPSSHEMQGDEGVPSRHTGSTEQNITITADSLKQRGASSVSPSKHGLTPEDMIELSARGSVDGYTSTEDIQHHTLSGTVLEGEMPVPSNINKPKLSRQSRWGIIAVTTGVVIVVAVVLLGRWKQFRETNGCFFKCLQRPRCPASSDCCDGTSVSSIAASNAEQNLMGNPVNHGIPVTVTIEHESNESPPSSNTVTQHTYLPSERTVVAADVHRDSVFNLFNIRQPVDSTTRSGLKYITHAETTINSTGGKLSSPDSNISIIVDSGAVPEGINQPFSFRVVYDETSLLRDIPESHDRTLISPLFYCGPDNINVLKPVEIIVPHCLYLDEVRKDSISVYRCGSYSDDGNSTIICSQYFSKGS